MDQPNNNDPTKVWFDSIPDVARPTPTPEGPKKSPLLTRKRLIILLSVLMLVTVAGVAFLLIQKPAPTAKACITDSDYELLTGKRNTDKQFSSAGIIYTAAIPFDNQAATYSKQTESASKASLERIAAFASSHRQESSFTLTISADYFENDSSEAANNRIATLRNFLIDKGVESASIRANQPARIDTSGELENNSEELAHATAYVSVSSRDQCQETK